MALLCNEAEEGNLFSMRILGIDYGTKRIGLALSDEAGRIAFPKEVVENTADVVDRICAYIEKEGVSTVVVGMPTQVAPQWQESIQTFVYELKKREVSVVEESENFSSHEAHQAAHQFGLTAIQTDKSAAALILQRYLDKQNNT